MGLDQIPTNQWSIDLIGISLRAGQFSPEHKRRHDDIEWGKERRECPKGLISPGAGLDVMTLTLTPITPITAFLSAVMTDDVDAVTGIFAAVMTDDVDAVTGISKKFRVTDDGDLGAGDVQP
uniref:Transposase n=1 Tax=Globodera pallida TaxID=36090 RepID=A0A183BZ85_GLOPA